MALARSFWIAPLAFLVFIALSNGQRNPNPYRHVLCYSLFPCIEAIGVVPLPHCCLDNGVMYRDDHVKVCYECVVFGWNVTQLTIREGTELSVQVVVLKGLRVLVNTYGLTYEVRLAPGGNATEGEDFEFERQTITFDFSTTEYPPISSTEFPPISITVPQDGIEREGTETFSLELVHTRGFGVSPDSFFNNTLEIIIEDEPPFSLRLINSSPRTHRGDISVEFIPSRPLKSAQCFIVNLLNFNRSTADCSSGRVRFQNVSSGLHRLRIVAIASTRGKAVERRTVFVCDEEEASCGVTLINEGVTVEGDCATIQFTSCGMVDSFMCRLNRDPFKPCRSPLRFCGLEVLKHRLLIFPFGKQCRKRGRLVANFEVI